MTQLNAGLIAAGFELLPSTVGRYCETWKPCKPMYPNFHFLLFILV